MRSWTLYAEQAKKIAAKAPWIYKTAAQLYARTDGGFPRHLFIETTAKCNLSCVYCPREKNDDHMDFRLFKAIVDEATHYGPRSFSLHLFGEPLLYPQIIEAIRYIKSKNKKHVILLTTNGCLLNHYVGDLVKYGVDEIIWSWRKEAKFKESTLDALRSSTRFGNTVFRVRILKEETPQEEIERWKTWPKVEIRNLHSYGSAIDISKWGVENPKERRWPCYHPFYAPAVAWNGEILICCADPHRESKLGTFPETSIAKAWSGDKIEQIRKEHKDGEYNSICKGCTVWKSYPNTFFGSEHFCKTAN